MFVSGSGRAYVDFAASMLGRNGCAERIERKSFQLAFERREVARSTAQHAWDLRERGSRRMCDDEERHDEKRTTCCYAVSDKT